MNSPDPAAEPPTRRIVLCADDFGMNSAVNAGILALAEQGRLSAASVLVDGPAAQEGMADLRDGALQLGLHLNLTEPFGQAGLCRPLRPLIQAAYLRRLSRAALQKEIQRQLARFRELVGRAPDYLDGHQHVHQLPGVRDALLAVLGRLQTARPWIRDTSHPRLAGLPWRLRFKARVIARLGSHALRRRAQRAGFLQNPGFLGVYDFQGGAAAYERWMHCWLAACADGDLLMCHPAKGGDRSDRLSAQRQAEYQVLAGPVVGQLLAAHHLVVAGRTPYEESS